MNFAQILAEELHIRPAQAQAVIDLLGEGATVPFIARYRKEAHGELDDQTIRLISERLEKLQKLEDRRKEILSSLEKLGIENPELTASVNAAATMAELEDVYRPYKPKRRTRAMIAREHGLAPLAETMLLQTEKNGTPEEAAAPYVNEENGVPDAQTALQGAMDIIAEQISDDANVRKELKDLYRRLAVVAVKAAGEEDSVYRTYYDYHEPFRQVPSHRALAIFRGEKEGFLKPSLEVNEESCVRLCVVPYYKGGSIFSPLVRQAAQDAYNRLLSPSLENELFGELEDAAQQGAVKVFAMNLKPLLMQPPLHGQITLALDPGYRNGCKTAVVDETGRLLDTAVLYPLFPNRVAESQKTLAGLITKYHVTAVAIGNGTASRETEDFFVNTVDNFQLGEAVSYMIVNEAGASVYSASPLAAKEFPQLDVNVRSAVSLARRLQDPLAELVKIDPKAIGVGQYQHDLKEADLDEALSGVVEDCVNFVGVDVNTASPALLSHVSGINKTVADNIVAYREENGAFSSRASIKKVPKLGPKAFEQCAGFLRIRDGKETLDNTSVHPESYPAARQVLKLLKAKPGDNDLGEKAADFGLDSLALQAETGVPTLKDIIKELQKPGRDPRDELPPPLMRKNAMHMEDLTPGMELYGTVRNVTDFGAFVDVGVHEDGLVHISRMAKTRVTHPSQVVKVGDNVKVRVVDVDVQKKRISLTMVW